MDNKVICACTVVALLGGAMVISVPAGPPQRGLHSDRHQGGGGSGRLSPASLDLDTCGCPTTFG